jgi:hypothetical protein
MRRYLVTNILELVPRQLISFYGVLTIAKDKYVAPIPLKLCQLVVHVELLFLSIENIDNNTNKHVQHEKGTGDHIEHEEQDLNGVIVLLWNFVDAGGVYCVPHYANPSFGCHYIE